MRNTIAGGITDGQVVPHADALVFEDRYSLYIRERHGVPDEWCWYSISVTPREAPAGTVKVVGAVAPLKRNGRRDWRKTEPGTERTFFVVLDELEAWRDERERATGNCKECSGHKKVLASAGVSGLTYRTCGRCNGRGAAPVEG